MSKLISILRTYNGNESVTDPMTIAEAVKYYKYMLETGESWQHEDGNAKINSNPKTAASLIKNLNNATNNAAANGYSGVSYYLA